MAAGNEALDWRGSTVAGSDGTPLGTIDEIYVDTDTGRPEWALVAAGAGDHHFLPLEGAARRGEEIRAAFPSAQVLRAPSPAAGADLSQDDEARLYAP